MKTRIFSLLLFLPSYFAFGQFEPNTIGVCYLKKETSDKYFLNITIPNGKWDTICYKPGFEFKPVADTLLYTGKIIFFDNNGEFYRLDNKEKFLLQSWCENDGGMHYQPMLSITIDKKKITRKIKAIKEIENICGFVLMNGTNDKLKNVNVGKIENIKLKGDYNHDGQTDCFVWTSFSEDTECGEMNRNYSIWLNVGEYDLELSCCGP